MLREQVEAESKWCGFHTILLWCWRGGATVSWISDKKVSHVWCCGYYSPRLSFRPLPCKLVIEWRICLKENILFGKICKVQVVCAMKIDASSSHYCSKNTVWIYHYFQITVWIRIQCICNTNHTNSLSSWKVRTIDYIFLSESTPGWMTLINTGFVFLTPKLPRSH